MTKQIQFPKNYARYIQLGQEALADQRNQTAISYLLKAYHISPEFPLNFLIVSTQFEIGEYQEALLLASDCKEDYCSCPEYANIYIQLLIKNQQFIQAHSTVNQLILQGKSQEMRQLILLKKQISRSELLFRQYEGEKIADWKDDLFRLGDFHYTEQLMKIKQANQLPQEDFLEITKKLLVDKNVHSIVKSWLIEELSRLDVREEIKVLWRGKEIRKVCPAEVGAPYDNAAYQRIILYLEKELINQDPVLLVNLKEEIQLQFALMFPFAEEIIKDPILWAISYIRDYSVGYYQEVDEELEQEIEEIKEIQQSIRFELNELIL